MKRLLVAIVIATTSAAACASSATQTSPPAQTASDRDVPLDGLPPDIRSDVAGVPSICLVARDPSDTLMIVTHDAAGNRDGGFMTENYVGREDYGLAKGVDSIALAGSYIVVGCYRDADMEFLKRQAFADAARRHVVIDLWIKTDTAWIQVPQPTT